MIKKIEKKWLISLYFIVAGLLCLYLIQSLQLRSDMSFFAPDSLSGSDKIIQSYLLESDANRLLFIQLGSQTSHSNSIKKLAQFSEQLVHKIQANKDFSLVENGHKSLQHTLKSQLYRYRYLITPHVADELTITSLKQAFYALQERLQIMVSPEMQIIIAESPLNIWFNYLKSLHGTQLSIKEGVWFNQDNQAILLIKTQAPGFSIAQQKQNIDFIDAQIKQLYASTRHSKDHYVNHYTISGAAMIALANSEQIAFQIKFISIIASLLLALFLGFIFRSIKVLLLLSLPLFFAILVGSSVVNFFYGYIHGISLAFGITIIGISVDYPIHYFTHLMNQQKGQTLYSNKAVILAIWPQLKLGLITTLIGFSALTFSSFSGLNQLGVFAMSGLISAALISRYLLPLFNYQYIDKKEPLFLSWMSFLLFKNRLIYRQFMLLLMLIAVVYMATYENITDKSLWENDLASLSPVSSELKQQDFKLRKSLNLPELRYLLLVSSETEQGVLQETEAISPFLEHLINSGAISFYDAITRYLPSIQTQITRQKNLPNSEQVYKNLTIALQESPFDIEAFRPFIHAIAENKQLPVLSPDDLEQSFFSTKIKSMLYQDKLYQDKLPKNSHQWTGLVLLSGVDGQKLSTAFHDFFKPSSRVQLIDIKQQTHNLVANYRSESVHWFLWGSLLIVLFLFVYIKKIVALPALVLPFSGAIIFTLSLLLLLGYHLSIFHLVTLLLVVGLGIDYSIFIYKSDCIDDREQVIRQFSVLVCMLSSFIMFFSLSLSSLPVLKAIGLTASMGTVLAFILSLIFSRPYNSGEASCKD